MRKEEVTSVNRIPAPAAAPLYTSFSSFSLLSFQFASTAGSDRIQRGEPDPTGCFVGKDDDQGGCNGDVEQNFPCGPRCSAFGSPNHYPPGVEPVQCG